MCRSLLNVSNRAYCWPIRPRHRGGCTWVARGGPRGSPPIPQGTSSWALPITPARATSRPSLPRRRQPGRSGAPPCHGCKARASPSMPKTTSGSPASARIAKPCPIRWHPPSAPIIGMSSWRNSARPVNSSGQRSSAPLTPTGRPRSRSTRAAMPSSPAIPSQATCAALTTAITAERMMRSL